MRPKIIVLDDDPTGSQTVHGCLLVTSWDEDVLREALADEAPLFFVLTNTRSVSAEEAAAVTREVCRNLRQPLEEHRAPWLIVSRSDSTLRGHYPVETDVIAEELGPFDAHFLTPEFFEGGRITRDGTHYVVRDGVETPAHETEFARDSVFGYSTAYLPAYVEEKTGGRIAAAKVELFDPSEPDGRVLERLRSMSGNACGAISAASQAELDRLASLLLQVAGEGRRFLFRSAASLLTSLADLPPQPVAPEEMARYVPDGRAGLVLVGSHVPMSTRQLERLIDARGASAPRRGGLVHIELDVGRLPDSDGSLTGEIASGVREAHATGVDVLLSTSREERTFDTAEERLAFGLEISRVLMTIVRHAPATLGFILSKGGITSNDVLSTGLGLRTARVAGQIHPGCSVVLTPPEHRHGSIPVVIFPGNVGDEESLRLVYDRLTAAVPTRGT
ncbi:MAG: four-carbon acid sugar kinase family protein [Spirochaetota bacterium]